MSSGVYEAALEIFLYGVGAQKKYFFSLLFLRCHSLRLLLLLLPGSIFLLLLLIFSRYSVRSRRSKTAPAASTLLRVTLCFCCCCCCLARLAAAPHLNCLGSCFSSTPSSYHHLRAEALERSQAVAAPLPSASAVGLMQPLPSCCCCCSHCFAAVGFSQLIHCSAAQCCSRAFASVACYCFFQQLTGTHVLLLLSFLLLLPRLLLLYRRSCCCCWRRAALVFS